MRRGLLARFASERGLVDAATAVVAEGYRELDAFTPRPIEELDHVLKIGRSNLSRSVFIAGAIGAGTGMFVQWFCNAWDYPLNVGGRPPFAIPAFIPITFEIMVLFAALTAFAGGLRRGGLPRLTDPLFAVDGFERASCDRFFLLVGAGDPAFDAERTRALLVTLGAEQIDAVPSPQPPRSAP